MNMKDWAEREVEIACARERKNSTEEGEWDYGCACYESALKVYKSLMEDGHSGFSIDLLSLKTWTISGMKCLAIDETKRVIDTIGIFHAIKPDGEQVNIYRYFKESDDGWEEITTEHE